MKAGGGPEGKRPQDDLSREAFERPIEDLLRELAAEIDEATEAREGSALRAIPKGRLVVRVTRHGRDN